MKKKEIIIIVALLSLVIVLGIVIALLYIKPWEKSKGTYESKSNNEATLTPITTSKPKADNKSNNIIEKNVGEKQEVKIEKTYYTPLDTDLVYTYMETNTIEGYGKYIIPQINLTGNSVNGINEEIRTIFDRILQSYNDSNVEMDYNYYYYQSALYKYYKNEDILSLIIECNTEDGGSRNYFVYNVDLTTNKKLTNDELLEKIGISDSEFRNKLLNGIIMLDLYKNGNSDFTSAQCNKTVELYRNKKVEDINLYINDLGHLTAELSVYNIVGGEFATCISDLITGASKNFIS